MQCGTYSGYKKHRKEKSFICQPCRLAMNAYRRDYHKRNPEKNAQYGNKYKAKFAPAKEAERAIKKAAREAAAAEKAAQLAVARAERAAVKAARRIEREAELAKVKANKAKVKAKVNAEKLQDALRAIRYQRKLIASQLAKHERQEALKAQKEQARLKREVAVATQQLRREQRELERQRLLKQHGTSIGDYSRCKKANTTACPPCRAVAAAYRRAQVAKDPAKFKQQDKAYYKKYPHKRVTNSRDRARKRGVPSQYYTRQQLFDRDGYDCYLCNLPVELTANHIVGQPGWELYPHVDHVIPLALGGHDTLDNVKITHAKCNMAKGASAPSVAV
jgi:5-methylcytosine-specific restriction endonuclease McrA